MALIRAILIQGPFLRAVVDGCRKRPERELMKGRYKVKDVNGKG
jgi:hypothetical protein